MGEPDAARRRPIVMHRLTLPALLVLAAVAGCSGGGSHDLTNATTSSTPASTLGSTTTTAVAPPTTTPPAATCPATLPQPVSAKGADKRLVPFTASSATVCRYSTVLAHPPNRLVRKRTVTDASEVAQLERLTNALHRISNAERIPCPLLATPQWVLSFVSAGASERLVASASDCGFVSNGVATASPTDAWTAALTRITSSG